VWLQRRFECLNRGHRHTEDDSEIEGKVTLRLARWLVRDSKCLTIRELSRRHRLSWHSIMGCCGLGGGRGCPSTREPVSGAADHE
jgi:hypothetical protein